MPLRQPYGALVRWSKRCAAPRLAVTLTPLRSPWPANLPPRPAPRSALSRPPAVTCPLKTWTARQTTQMRRRPGRCLEHRWLALPPVSETMAQARLMRLPLPLPTPHQLKSLSKNLTSQYAALGKSLVALAALRAGTRRPAATAAACWRHCEPTSTSPRTRRTRAASTRTPPSGATTPGRWWAWSAEVNGPREAWRWVLYACVWSARL